ncbi:unnamed protein product [Calypogeia fissa]
MLSLRTRCCDAFLAPPIAFPLGSKSPFLTLCRTVSHQSPSLAKALLQWSRRSRPISTGFKPAYQSVSCSGRLPAVSVEATEPEQLPSMGPLDSAELRDAFDMFPAPPGVKFSYGTAGFRTDGSLLKSTVFRTGVLAALRSLCTKQATGLMITASHNPVADNGIKLADPSGGMLTMEWEEYANELANTNDSNSFLQVIQEIVKKESIRLRSDIVGNVLLARDTRPSGAELLAAAKKGVETVHGVVAQEKGILTTPQLHWMVRAFNRVEVDTESQYYDTLSFAFRSLLDLRSSAVSEIDPVVVVDGANGVGASKLFQLQEKLETLKMEIRNTGQDGKSMLNFCVGADYVQKEKVLPQSFHKTEDAERRCVSIDGDADRLVYFYYGCKPKESTSRLHLLDGDKIMALFATFIKEQLCVLADIADSGDRQIMDESKTVVPGYGSITVGAGQTAYANGASTTYLKEKLGIEVALTPTGVKHLHEKAAAYDIGLYFEANGHGTILYKESFINWLKKVGGAGSLEGEKLKAVRRLLAVSEMVNQAIGDALSGILMVELVLHYKGWSIKDWDSIYEDVPSRQLKVSVADRSIITTTCAETKVSSPIELQQAIDEEIVKCKNGRSFVRPSGTEDVVRVYAEAADQASADALAQRVRALVYKHAGGVGPEPPSY